ncbi:SiaB family protein kinase [Herbaspirillum sp. LeCh32-8]|uniref:SiaB family protein kinase n=1 Tax=Herbaspirillum sp. LeCh32-8 TaxID=2821356 RepID=UPI001AE777C5|nr:SiaB family protein kinase [Herbaspirillum sp. LeCh32-8]MBP0597534.1 SiaB family protein kinase [Herbaspirillum sp. LeCh32-8]
MSGIQTEWAEFHRYVERRDVIFYYVGYFSQSIIAAMADAVKLRAEYAGAMGQTRRKLFSSFVEMAQNIVHYSSDLHEKEGRATEPSMRHGAVFISLTDGVYYLHCANPVDSEMADKLRPKLERLRSLTIDEIKAEYKEMLRAETPPDSKGAGLGFLTVARDASAPLDFEFSVPDADGASTFYLRATI